MEMAKSTGKRAVEGQEARRSSSPSAKRRMTARPNGKKATAATVKKDSLAQLTSRSPSKDLATPPSEPEIIDLCVEVEAKLVGRHTFGGFPRSKDGDVIIDLGMLGGTLSYQLHSRILSRVSAWFDETLKHPIREIDDGFAANYTKRTGIRARYELTYNSDLKTFVLARATLTKIKGAKGPPATTSILPSSVDPHTPASAVKNVPVSIEQLAMLSKLPLVSEQPNATSIASLAQSSHDAPADRLVNYESPNNISVEGQHNDMILQSVPRQSTIKIDPEIKQEEHVLSAGAFGNDSTGTKREAAILAKENQAGPKEAPTTGYTTRDSVINNYSQVSTQENQPEPMAILVSTEQNYITTNIQHNVPVEKTQVTNQEDLATPPSAELMAAYKGLFRIYYGQTPVIDTKDISVALQQVETIIRVAELYGSIPSVRPYLGNCLIQFGRGLYEAILQDPPRWLQLSLYLGSRPIFKEATVHIIGNLGHWPWTTVQVKDLPVDLISLLQSKVDNLKRLVADIERTLFTTSINLEGEQALLAPTDKRSSNTWLVAHKWKDWFSRAVTKDEIVPNSTRRSDGAKYRLIAKGGDAYLTLETVINFMNTFRERLTKADKQGIEEDLKMIKTFAQKQVQPLCVHHSMLSVEDTDIEHLTCASVDIVDIPEISWVKQDVPRLDD